MSTPCKCTNDCTHHKGKPCMYQARIEETKDGHGRREQPWEFVCDECLAQNRPYGVATEFEFTELPRPVRAGCERRQCVNDATFEATWNKGHSRALLCTTDKKELEERPGLLRQWFQIGPL